MRAFLLKVLACVGSGCLWFLACADFDVWILAWFAFLPCLLVLRTVSPPRAFFWAWLTGLVANAGGFYWITTLLVRFGHLPMALAVVLFIAMMLYQGFHFGVMGWALGRLRRKRPGLPMTLLLPLTMTPLELVMPFIFPWYLSITQAWVVPVIQVADLAGPTGVTFLLLLVNGAVYDLVEARLEGRPLPWRPAAAAAAIVALALVYGGVRMAQYDSRWEEAPKVKLGIVQANIGIVEKGRARLAPEHLQIHHEVSRELQRQGAELLVWPESSYPYFFWRKMERDWPEGSPRRVMQGLEVPLVFGVITYGEESDYPYNSAMMMSPEGEVLGRFDKNYLLVFGEYIPFYDQLPRFKEWFPEASHFSRGSEVTTFPFRDWRLGPMICYEDIIPSFGRRLARLRPHLLVNITNDAWFGATSEPYEHLALSVYRAVELRTGLVRAVNTGVSVLVDANGRVLQQTRSVDPVVTPGVKPDSLLGEVAMMEGGHTVYAAVGDLFGYLLLAGLLALFFWPTPRPAAPARKPRRRKSKGSRKK